MLINRVSVLLLLTGHGALGSLAGARIRLGPLTANRQTAAVTQALIASDLDLAANIGGHLTTEVTLNLECALDVVTQLDELCVAQVLHTGIRADSRFGQGLARTGAAHHRCKSRRLPRAFHVECRLRQVVPWVLSPVVVSEVLMQTCPWSPKVSGPRPEVSSRVRVPEALTSQAC